MPNALDTQSRQYSYRLEDILSIFCLLSADLLLLCVEPFLYLNTCANVNRLLSTQRVGAKPLQNFVCTCWLSFQPSLCSFCQESVCPHLLVCPAQFMTLGLCPSSFLYQSKYDMKCFHGPFIFPRLSNSYLVRLCTHSVSDSYQVPLSCETLSWGLGVVFPHLPQSHPTQFSPFLLRTGETSSERSHEATSLMILSL